MEAEAEVRLQDREQEVTVVQEIPHRRAMEEAVALAKRMVMVVGEAVLLMVPEHPGPVGAHSVKEVQVD